MDNEARQDELDTLKQYHLQLLTDAEDRLGQLNRDDPRLAHLANANQVDGAMQENQRYLEVTLGSGS